MRKTTEYTVVLDVNVRYRVRHEIERDKVLRYVVQLEVKETQQWHPVQRSDRAHGQAHWPIFHRRKKAERIVLEIMPRRHKEKQLKNSSCLGVLVARIL